jgi:NAD(P)-dependent dehydrogenase (short-subunit alcohol dehydrogenase family)
MGSALDGRVALVTGAGRGIGREIAIGLAAAGARVALLARTQSQLDEVAEAIEKADGTAIKIPADLGDQQTWRPAVDATARLLGRVDILINNAAVVAPLGPTQNLEPADVRAALTINVAAVVVLSSLVLPGMLTGGWGRIVNLSSGIVDHPAAMIGGNIYSATKAALEAHTLNLAAEVDGTGVTVNAYRPGAVDTAMQAWIRNQSPDAIGHALHDRFLSSYASGELLSPDVSAAQLLERLSTSESGRIWSVSDPPKTRASN